jgi:hypothetical protein
MEGKKQLLFAPGQEKKRHGKGGIRRKIRPAFSLLDFLSLFAASYNMKHHRRE